MFNKASTRRAFEDVFHQVREAIVDGRLKPGDRLPPQRELKELFQVSRATVMEALRVLEQAGLITIRPGTTGGAFISHATSGTVADSLLLLLDLNEVSLEELAEFRERVEGGTAYWAASRADDAAVATLEDHLRKLRALADVGTPWSFFLAEEMKIHWAVAEYSGNRPSVVTMQAITRAMQEAYTFISPGLYEKVISDFQAILEAIRLHDPALAEERMKAHIAFFNQDMMANRKAQTSHKKKPQPNLLAFHHLLPSEKPWSAVALPQGSADEDPVDRIVRANRWP